MIREIKTCAFTGHRPKSFSFGYDESDPAFFDLKNKIRNTIVQVCNAGCRTFYCGMAQGADLWCAETVLEMKEQFTPALKIVPVVPYLSQPSAMSDLNKERYRKIMDLSDERYLVSKEYHKTCFYKRNRFMVDSTDALIAIYKKGEDHSGTAQTIRYARSKGKKIFIIEI